MPRRGETAGGIRLLVVEDNRLVREGIVSLLSRHGGDIEVTVAEGADSALSHILASSPPPPIVVVDAGLADHDSATLVQRIRRAVPEARVIVMDLLPGPEDIVEFVQAGACGFIMKDATVEAFVQTIRRVAAGQDVLPPALTEALFSQIAESVIRRPRRGRQLAVRLTPREREVIGLIAEGLSNKEIAPADPPVPAHREEPRAQYPREARPPQPAGGRGIRAPRPGEARDAVGLSPGRRFPAGCVRLRTATPARPFPGVARKD